jgi:hypothetical protein
MNISKIVSYLENSVDSSILYITTSQQIFLEPASTLYLSIFESFIQEFLSNITVHHTNQ